MDKDRIIGAVIVRLEEELQNFCESLASVTKAVTDAPGAMQSHSDTTRFQQGRVADELQRQLREKECTIMLLASFRRTIRPSPTKQIGIGSLVEIEEGGAISMYLILPEGGGVVVRIDDVPISILTAKAPLAAALMNHVSGDVIRFGLNRQPIRVLTILDVG